MVARENSRSMQHAKIKSDMSHSDPSDILKSIKAIYVEKMKTNLLEARNTKNLESLKN